MDKHRKRWNLHSFGRQLFSWVLIWSIWFSMTAYAKPDWPADTGIQAEAGIVMDLDSGAVLLGQNSHVEYPPASITKLLTALIVAEHADLTETVTFSETAINNVESDSGNKFGFVVGDTLSVEDCLYALLLQSVNQSANALAEHVAGSIPAFVDMMNEKVAELGLSESHFENPSGLNGDTHYVSAYDMAKIAQAAFDNETVLMVSSAVSRTLGPISSYPEGFTISNEHRLVSTQDAASEYYYPPAKAGKTGYLLRAGNTLVTYAEQDGRRLVSVILKGSRPQYFLDGKTLLEFGFSRFKNVDIAENETRYVTGEEQTELFGVTCVPSELMVEPGRVLTLPKDAEFADAEVSLAALPDNYPIGSVALLTYTYNEREIGSAYLVKKAEYTGEMLHPAPVRKKSAAQDTDAEESSARADGEQESGAGPAASDEETKEAVPAGGAGKAYDMWLIGAVAAGAAAVLGAAGILFLVLYKRKKEAEAAALRRERRRQRLMEAGAEVEAEFNRLMEEKRSRDGGRGRRR